MEKLVIFGTNNFANEVVHKVEQYNLYDVVGFTVNQEYMKSDEYMGKKVYPVEELEKYFAKNEIKIFSAISRNNYLNRVRKEKFDELKSHGYTFANIISPHAIVCTDNIGEGNWINDFAHIGYDAKIGNNNIIGANTSISHYAVVGNHNSFSLGVCMGGHSVCGDCNFFGLNSVVFNRVIVRNKCIVGGGAVVKKDIKDFSLCVAAETIIRQCSEEMVEHIISPNRAYRTLEELEELKKEM